MPSFHSLNVILRDRLIWRKQRVDTFLCVVWADRSGHSAFMAFGFQYAYASKTQLDLTAP